MKKVIQRLLSGGSLIYKLLQQLYWTFNWRPRPGTIDSVLSRYAYMQKDVFFIQVGANDGKTDDPLHDYIIQNNWRGILIEPLPHVFQKLKDNYKKIEKNLIFENIAIAENDGEKNFYRFESSPGERFLSNYDLLGTFNKSFLLGISENGNLIVEEKVKALSFDSLIARHHPDKINLICIDTESYDYEIIKQINLKELNVDIIIYEHAHLYITDYKKSITYLKSNGYKLYHKYGDTIAVKRGLFKGNRKRGQEGY
jgi:FkbM family methyltransferase